MSKYPSVRPKPAKPQKVSDDGADRALRIENAIRDAARELYLERDGASIDKSISRYDNLLEIHDAEVAKLKGREDQPYRWNVSPSVMIRLEREKKLLLKQRDDLKNECFTVARQIVEQWVGSAPAQQAQSPGAQTTPTPHYKTTTQAAPTQPEKGVTAEAAVSAG